MFNHVLVPVDRSTLPTHFYTQLDKFFGGMRLKITLLHVSNPMPPMFYSDAVIGANYESQKEHIRAVNSYAEKIFSQIDQHINGKYDIERLHILNEDVSSGILVAIRRTKPDLILMMPNRDANFFDRLIGTKTYSVIMHTKIPVLTI